MQRAIKEMPVNKIPTGKAFNVLTKAQTNEIKLLIKNTHAIVNKKLKVIQRMDEPSFFNFVKFYDNGTY